MSDFLAGQVPTAAEMNTAALAGTFIDYALRTSNSTASASEQGVLYTGGGPALAGRRYRIYTNEMGADSSVANDTIRINLRYTTDGSTPTTSSTLLSRGQAREVDAAIPAYVSASGTFVPSSDCTLRVLLTTSRAGGTGLVGVNGGANDPIEIMVEDKGEDTGDSGTDV